MFCSLHLNYKLLVNLFPLCKLLLTKMTLAVGHQWPTCCSTQVTIVAYCNLTLVDYSRAVALVFIPSCEILLAQRQCSSSQKHTFLHTIYEFYLEKSVINCARKNSITMTIFEEYCTQQFCRSYLIYLAVVIRFKIIFISRVERGD